MELMQLIYFRAVAEKGSVTRAAESLHMTQPALSRSIARLEKELGAPLFTRRSHRVELNPCGKIFLEYTEKSLQALESGVQAVKRQHSRENSRLSLTCSAEDFLADMLVGFSARYPEIGIRQYRHADGDVEKYLENGSIELAVSMKPIVSAQLEEEIISRAEYVLVCSSRRRLTEPVSLAELKDEDFICDESRMNSQELARLCEGAGFVPRVTHEVEHAKLVYELISADAGVSLLPLPAYRRLEARYGQGELGMYRIAEPCTESCVSVHWLKGHALSENARLFIEYLRELMALEQQELEN